MVREDQPVEEIASATVRVLGTTLAYRQVGHGRPVLLLHGNPTPSFLWRHVLQRVAKAQRNDGGCRWIAIDLVGMGASGKPDLDYRLGEHAAHIDAFVEALGLRDLVLVTRLGRGARLGPATSAPGRRPWVGVHGGASASPPQLGRLR